MQERNYLFYTDIERAWLGIWDLWGVSLCALILLIHKPFKQTAFSWLMNVCTYTCIYLQFDTKNGNIQLVLVIIPLLVVSVMTPTPQPRRR